MTEQESLEALVKEVAAGTEKILRSAPTLAAVNGEQACHLLVRALDAWGTTSTPSA